MWWDVDTYVYPYKFYNFSLDTDDEREIHNVIDQHITKERISCFDHTLHLVVCDGLTETKVLSAALSKVCKLSSLLHQSKTFREAFDTSFGKDKGIPAAVNTCWNSLLKQIKSVILLDSIALSQLLTDQGHKNLILTSREHNQVQELVVILEPFHEATLLTEGSNIVAISLVLPCVLSLLSHLAELMTRVRFCGPVLVALQTSIHNRFHGMLKKLNPAIESKKLDGKCLSNYSSDLPIALECLANRSD